MTDAEIFTQAGWLRTASPFITVDVHGMVEWAEVHVTVSDTRSEGKLTSIQLSRLQVDALIAKLLVARALTWKVPIWQDRIVPEP